MTSTVLDRFHKAAVGELAEMARHTVEDVRHGRSNVTAEQAEICSLVATAIAARRTHRTAEALGDACAICESPIEAYMLAALALTAQMYTTAFVLAPPGPAKEHVAFKKVLDGWPYDSDFRPVVARPLDQVDGSDWIAITPQFSVGKYRADFMVEAWAMIYEPDLPSDKDYKRVSFRVLVECDGHDFHDRTKEQVARDKSRDRALTATGHPVMRFSGSEIYRDPIKCALEVLDFVVAQVSALEAAADSRISHEPRSNPVSRFMGHL